MVEFMNKAMNWVLQKEQEAANHCYIKSEDVQKQLDTMQQKKEELQARYEQDVKDLDHIISRLTLIKASASRCRR